MSIHPSRIPVLPDCPRVRPFDDHIIRSYPVGRQSFSRACQGEDLVLTITSGTAIPKTLQAKLVSTMNSITSKNWSTAPFENSYNRTLVCHITPMHPGLHSFHAEFSLDNGSTWIRDTVPEAWILIDPKQVDGLRIYTLVPTVSGTISDWKADLSRIRDMGFNAIHLLPITALDTSESPYAAHDFFEIDHSYLSGSAGKDGYSEIGEFVEEAKSLNIRLCFDLVLNHVGVNSNMAQRAPDWLISDPNQADGFQRAHYWTGEGWRSWDDLILINYEHPSEIIRKEIWSYMTDYALFWAKYANDTGGFVRFDNLHSSNPDFVNLLTLTLHSKYPEVGILAEYFTDETTLLHTGPQWGLNLNLATPWNYKFVPQLREYLKYIHRVSSHIRYFMPVTSHDSGTPAQEFGSTESTIPRYVAAALLGTGATGIMQGIEFGDEERIKFIGRQAKRQYPAEARFGRFIAGVNAILIDYPAFRQGENISFVDNGHEAIIAAFRRNKDVEKGGFLVVCNFDIYHTQSITMDLSAFLGKEGPFECLELISSQSQTFQTSGIELSLQPSSAKVLKFPGTSKLKVERD